MFNFLQNKAVVAVLGALAVVTIALNVLLARDPSAIAGDLSKTEIEKIVREYILENPEVLVEAMNRLGAKQESEQKEKTRNAIAKNESQIFKSASDYVAGNPDGDVTIVEFFDYRCGYCKRMRGPIADLVARDKKVRVVLKEFPILGKESEIASQAAIAAKMQGKYWDFHLALLDEPEINADSVLAVAKAKGLDIVRLQKDMKSAEVKAIIDRNHDLARTMGVDSTPTFIVGREPVAGALSPEKLDEMIAAARKS